MLGAMRTLHFDDILQDCDFCLSCQGVSYVRLLVQWKLVGPELLPLLLLSANEEKRLVQGLLQSCKSPTAVAESSVAEKHSGLILDVF